VQRRCHSFSLSAETCTRDIKELGTIYLHNLNCRPRYLTYILATLAMDGSTTITDTVLFIFITLTVSFICNRSLLIYAALGIMTGVFVLKVNICPSGNGQGILTHVAIDDGRNKYGSNTGVLG